MKHVTTYQNWNKTNESAEHGFHELFLAAVIGWKVLTFIFNAVLGRTKYAGSISKEKLKEVLTLVIEDLNAMKLGGPEIEKVKQLAFDKIENDEIKTIGQLKKYLNSQWQ